MATLAGSLVASSSRRMPIRVRPDLEYKKQRYQGRTYWVVKDPIALQYFRFEEEEFAILNMLDGMSSLEQIGERFEAEFPPQTIRVEELQHFIGTLHRSGLVIADAPGQGEQLNKRGEERRWAELKGKLTNVLSIRFKGFDPERILTFLYSLPPVQWFFSKTGFILCMMLVAAAGSLVLVEFDTFQSKLPGFNAFFAADNWLLMAAVLCVTKALHEFGHGLSCKHFGGECHEMGIMFLVLTPCPYCNVSDSWMLPNRWHRAAIGAAGMYVEVVLASIATFIWWFTEEGFLHYTCLNIMFVSSVSTILFNANPLLKYDGYYILSDILEIPNLRTKASKILSTKLGAWCLGLEEQEDQFLPKRHQWVFAIYTVAAALYRWVVVLSIAYFLIKVFEPYGLKPLGQLIALSAIWGLAGQPLWKLYKYFKVPGRLYKVKRAYFWTTTAVVAALLAAGFTIPLPARVFCPMVIHPQGASTVYIEAPGLLDEIFVKAGDTVNKGDVLARLMNLDLERSIAKLEGEIEVYKTEINSLKQISFNDPTASPAIAQISKSLASAEKQLAKQREDAERLILRAPEKGTVLPTDYKPERPHPAEELDRWFGSPLDEKNLGTPLSTGEQFCRVGNPNLYEAHLAIDQANVALVETGQRVEMMLNQSTDLAYVGQIESVERDEMEATPARLSSLTGGVLPTQSDRAGTPKPLEPYFSAIVNLGDYDRLPDSAKQAHDKLRIGLVGEAKVHVEPRTVWQRIWRYLSRTINFDL